MISDTLALMGRHCHHIHIYQMLEPYIANICQCIYRTNNSNMGITIVKIRRSNCHAFISSSFYYYSITWYFTSKSSAIKIEKVHKAALCVVYFDNMTSCSGILDMSNRTPLFSTRLKGQLVECIRGLNPEFMNTLLVMDNQRYDNRSGSTISQTHTKTIR